VGTRDPRVDAYIANAAEFAQPVLVYLRNVVHAACPEVEETMKWSMPHFTYKGILCGMAAFKEHCAFGFWKEKLIFPSGDGTKTGAMGQLGRITSRSDLPPRKVLLGYIREAVRLNEQDVKVPKSPASRRSGDPAMPAQFRRALAQHPSAQAAFKRFSPSQQREYVAWIAEAKREETQARRIGTAVEWIAESKPRNWKYLKPKAGEK
jgi:uncharacterized protein YdeI (YjbR/CyaY-like superfamily)